MKMTLPDRSGMSLSGLKVIPPMLEVSMQLLKGLELSDVVKCQLKTR